MNDLLRAPASVDADDVIRNAPRQADDGSDDEDESLNAAPRLVHLHMHEYPSESKRVTHFLQDVLQMKRVDMQALSSNQTPFMQCN